MTSPLTALRSRLGTIDTRWRDLPLRTRLTSAAALAATLTIVAVVGVAYAAVKHELRSQVDRDLIRQAGDSRLNAFEDMVSGAIYVQLPRAIDEASAYVQAVDSQGNVATIEGTPAIPVSSRDIDIAQRGGTWLRDATVSGIHVRLYTRLSRPSQNGSPVAIQLAVPLTGVDHQLHALALLFAFLAAGGFGLTALASWGAVRRTMRPVQSLTETAEEIAETRDLTLRIASHGDDELGRLAGAFNTMLDALERSLGQQRQLVMDASHELRTPLASLRTNVEVLKDVDRLTPAQRDSIIAAVVSQLEELTGLVADVVELARGDAPASTFEDVSWDEIVEHAVDRARRHWPSVTFACRARPVVVRGVTGRIERAVANMLDNAGKFSPDGAIVEVDLSSGGVLTVADRGPGIPVTALPHVFDRFYRADEARAMPGSGLGLAIVKQVVDGLGGTIELRNRAGGGAVATMTLPVRPADQPAETPPPVPVAETLFH